MRKNECREAFDSAFEFVAPASRRLSAVELVGALLAAPQLATNSAVPTLCS